MDGFFPTGQLSNVTNFNQYAGGNYPRDFSQYANRSQTNWGDVLNIIFCLKIHADSDRSGNGLEPKKMNCQGNRYFF